MENLDRWVLIYAKEWEMWQTAPRKDGRKPGKDLASKSQIFMVFEKTSTKC